MFTGIIKAVGEIVAIGARLKVEADLQPMPEAGASVCVDGCCLSHIGGELLEFDLSDETLRRTRFSDLRPGDKVNIEPSLNAGDPLDGHFVLGHVDEAVEFEGMTQGDVGAEYRFKMPRQNANLIAEKGCVAINGVSLTVAALDHHAFKVWLVPITLRQTNLGLLVPGERVNLEFDVLARYAARSLTKTFEDDPIAS